LRRVGKGGSALPLPLKPWDHDDLRNRADESLAEMASAPTKDNPKRAFGILKACLWWWPMAVIFETALAFAEGGFKYGGHNYLVAPVSARLHRRP
jgi:hypothetical protein